MTLLVPAPTGRYPGLLRTGYGGRGVAFPFQPTPSGGVLVAVGDDLIRASVWAIIDTDVGEGIYAFWVKDGVPFGTRLRRYRFESTQHVKDLAGYEIRRALHTWEPRIDVLGVDVDGAVQRSAGDPSGLRTVRILVRYVIVATGTQDRAVVPLAR